MPDNEAIVAPWTSFGNPPMAGSVGRACEVCGLSVNVELGGGDALGINRPNVDCRALPTVDFCLDLAAEPLPFHDEHAVFVRMLHVLNHLSADAGRRVLRECWRILRPEGYLFIMVTDVDFICERIVAEGASACWLACLHGATDDRRPEEWHKWNYSADSLVEVLTDVGFARVQPVGYYNRWDLKVLAVKA